MTDKQFSRRRVLQIASVVAVPSLILGSDRTSVAAEAVSHSQPTPSDSENTKDTPMNLGAFSVSLTVKDLEASKKFYEKLGFKSFAGNAAQNWLVMRNGEHVIGLFQGMFDKNILTFNPGWDQNAKKLDSFTDVRELQRHLKSQGVKLTTEADETTKGPASFTLEDPDGNQILFDQHV